MRRIRSFVKDDIPHVVKLRQKCFRFSQKQSPQVLAAYFEKIFFLNPWYDESLPSLVCEEDGGIIGFMGVIPQTFLMEGRRLRVVAGSQFMVDPSRRGYVALALLKTFLSGRAGHELG